MICSYHTDYPLEKKRLNTAAILSRIKTLLFLAFRTLQPFPSLMGAVIYAYIPM